MPAPHSHGHPTRPVAARGASLMLMSFGQRLAGVAVLLLALWAAIFWALGMPS